MNQSASYVKIYLNQKCKKYRQSSAKLTVHEKYKQINKKWKYQCVFTVRYGKNRNEGELV